MEGWWLPAPAVVGPVASTSYALPPPPPTAEQQQLASGASAGTSHPHHPSGGSTSTSDAPSAPPPVKKRKRPPEGLTRNRKQLSCTECSRKKIKCDKVRPCEACRGRGLEATCDAGEGDGSPGSQTGEKPSTAPSKPSSKEKAASSSSANGPSGGGGSSKPAAQTALEARLAHLEAIVLGASSASSYKAAYPSAGVPPSSSAAPQQSQQQQPSGWPLTGAGAGAGVGKEKEEDVDSETEDAALTLEDLAVGIRMARVRARTGAPDMMPDPPVSSSSQTQGVATTNGGSSGTYTPAIERAKQTLLVPRLLASERKPLLNALFAYLPASKGDTDWLVGTYFRDVEWGWSLHHERSFTDEYAAFGLLMADGRRSEIDPLWLAVLFQTLCLASNALDAHPGSHVVSFTQMELQAMPGRFFEAARMAMELGDWTGTPRLRAVQAVAMAAPYLLFCGEAGAIERLSSLIASGVRICQHLGLHKAPSSITGAPDEIPDTSVLPLSPSARSLFGRRIFYAILFLDQIIFRFRPMLPLSEVGAEVPGDREGEQAEQLESLRWKVGVLQRRFHEEVIGKRDYGYDSVLEVDRGFRELLNAPALSPPQNKEESLQTFWARTLMHQNMHVRLLRIHRPFMSRGLRDGYYSSSARGTFEAARRVLELQGELGRAGAPLLRGCFHLLHIQTAVVSLFFNIWGSTDRNDPTSLSDQSLIRGVLVSFEEGLNSIRHPVRRVARQSLQVARMLFEALEARWRAGQVHPTESYSNLLKRIGTVVSSMDVGFSPWVKVDTPGTAGSGVTPQSMLSNGKTPGSAGPVADTPGYSSNSMNQTMAPTPLGIGAGTDWDDNLFVTGGTIDDSFITQLQSHFSSLAQTAEIPANNGQATMSDLSYEWGFGWTGQPGGPGNSL